MPMASLLNLFGGDLLVIFSIYAFILGLIVVGIRLLLRGLSRPKGSEERLKELDSLRSRGLITEEEYQKQRQTILAQI